MFGGKRRKREGAARERQLLQRHREAGETSEESGNMLTPTLYEMPQALDVIARVRTLAADVTDRSAPELLEAVAEARVRWDEAAYGFHGVGLVSFSSPVTLERERLELARASAEGAKALEVWFSAASPDARKRLGSHPTFDGLVQAKEQEVRAQIEAHIRAKDERFEALFA